MLQRKNRRTFLKGLLGTAAAVSTASIADASAVEATAAVGARTTAKSGYHETDHIRDYYRKVNF